MTDIRRINPNIGSGQVEESKQFYGDFLGLKLVMDMHWIMTFASESNPTAQISIVPKELTNTSVPGMTITIEVNDIDGLHARAKAFNYKIVYPLTTEQFGVRRFAVEDPNGVIVNLMCHL